LGQNLPMFNNFTSEIISNLIAILLIAL